MGPGMTTPAPDKTPGLAAALGPALALAALVALAYWNSFSGTFLFDDIRFVKFFQNTAFPPTLEELHRAGFAARPFIGLTFALNQALFGPSLFGYHLINLALHLSAALALYGVAARTPLPDGADARRWSGPAFGFLAAALWALHPVQTQAVTYIVQRCESAMGLFFFLALSCALRGWTGARRTPWHLAALAAFVLAVASKETALILPLVLLGYDLLFRRQTLGRTLRESPVLYGGFAAMAALGSPLVLDRLRGYYLDAPATSLADHLLAQCQVFFAYLKLVLWPANLSFDHAWTPDSGLAAWLAPAGLAAWLGGTGWLLARRSRWGFAPAFFLLALAPVTFFVRLDDALAEHRLYLPSAALCVLAAAGLRLLPGIREGAGRLARLAAPGLLAPALVLALLTGLTLARNADYAAGELNLWQDVLAKQPDNRRANYVVAGLLAHSGRAAEALPHLQAAVRPGGHMNPGDYVLAMNLYGELLHNFGRTGEAIGAFRHVLAYKPDNRQAQIQLGHALNTAGRYAETIATLPAFLAADPGNSLLNYELGVAYGARAMFPQAVACLRLALTGTPLVNDYNTRLMAKKDEAYAYLGMCQARTGDRAGAVESLTLAVQSGARGDLLRSVQAELAALGAVPGN